MLEAQEKIEGKDQALGCNELSAAVTASPGVQARLPDFERLAGMCVDFGIADVTNLPAKNRSAALSNLLATTPPAMMDATHRARVESAIAALGPSTADSGGLDMLGLIGTSPGGPKLSAEHDVTVNGRLPPEVIQRIVRQNRARFTLCYEIGLRTNPSLAGRVIVRFTIDSSGNVSTATDDQSTPLCPAFSRRSRS